MSDITLYNAQGEKIGTETLPAIFDVTPNETLLYEAVIGGAANERGTYVHTKGKGAVRGGGRKPWRQKGTGRARHGSIRSPIWRKGGVVFGPRPERTFKKKINRKVGRVALIHALAAKVKGGSVVAIDSLDSLERKTKAHAAFIALVRPQNARTLVVVGTGEKDRVKYFKNIPRVALLPAGNMNAYETVRNSFIVMTREALRELISRTTKPIRALKRNKEQLTKSN